jgi:hypothetical protein
MCVLRFFNIVYSYNILPGSVTVFGQGAPQHLAALAVVGHTELVRTSDIKKD